MPRSHGGSRRLRVRGLCPDYAQLDLYLKRLEKELSIPEEEIGKRGRRSLPILSENTKCSVSLDLPVLNCQPTKVCREVCYACQGRQFYRAAIVKSIAVDRLIREDPEQAAWCMAREAEGRPIRLAGSGELLPENRALLDYLGKRRVEWWGFTKRTDTYEAMPQLMFSVDAGTPTLVLDYVERNVPVRRRCYMRRPEDGPAPLEITVTFPLHGPTTNYVDEVPEERTDCPAIRKRADGCWDCRRCY